MNRIWLEKLQDTGIRPEALEDIRRLAEKYELEQVVLFGSRARGDYHRASDIDLAVSGGNIVRFAVDVEEDVATLLTFDVINLDSNLQPELRAEIEKDGRVIYEKV